MANTIKIKRGLKANLPTLEIGEQAYCTDTNELFIGTATGNELINEETDISQLSNIGDVEFTDLTTGNVLTFDGTNWVNDTLPEPTLPNQASISASGTFSGTTGSVTTTHLRQVNASESSTASGENSQVNASRSSTASNRRSQVNASVSATASGHKSQINASNNSTASGENSQINASVSSTASSFYSQVNASQFSSVGGEFSQINASDDIDNNRNFSVVQGTFFTQRIRLESDTGVGRFRSGTSTSGFDFAELFENGTGKEIEPGKILTIKGDKVEPAQENNRVIGVVSHTYGFLGNGSDMQWEHAELRDEWGRVIMEEVKDPHYKLESEVTEEEKENSPYKIVKTEEEIPLITRQKQNPLYDHTLNKDYTPRVERPEKWTPVGLVGQVYVRLNKDVKPGDSVKAWKDGIGQTSETDTNIVVMKITQPYDSKKGYAIGFCLIK